MERFIAFVVLVLEVAVLLAKIGGAMLAALLIVAAAVWITKRRRGK